MAVASVQEDFVVFQLYFALVRFETEDQGVAEFVIGIKLQHHGRVATLSSIDYTAMVSSACIKVKLSEDTEVIRAFWCR